MTVRETMTLRQEQAVETRQKLLNSALKLFAEQGYAGTKVRDINRSIGMADGLMYHYFPGGKKEIMTVLIQEQSQQILSELKSRFRDLVDLPLEEVLEQVYHNADAVFTKYLNAFKIIYQDSEARELARDLRLDFIVITSRKWFPELLRQRAAAGEIREIDYESATEMLVAVVMHHFMLKLTSLLPRRLEDPEYRKKLIAYQVGLWKQR